MAETNKVFLRCIDDHGKLRVRIMNPGFYTSANCQFPRDLRVDGRYFRVSPEHIKLITTRGKYYYSIKNKKDIEIVVQKDVPEYIAPSLKVYEDIEQEECLLCYDAPKETVFSPCGHFYTYSSCSVKCSKCPICRVVVSDYINKKDMD
jgi:hypothetical protein